MMNWTKGLTAAVLAGALVLGGSGCAKDQKDAAASGNSLQQIQEDRANFENEKDPPINADTHFAAGQLAESQGNLGNAVAQYEAALKIDSSHQPALFRLGVVHAELKEYDQAVEIWQRYIKATKGSATGYSNLGFAYELSGNANEAEAAYKKGIAKDPQNQACRVNYGLMLARVNRVGEATQQLSAVLSEAQVHYNLASVYEQRGRTDLARVEYRKAIQLDPNLQDAKTRLAALQ